MAIRVRELEDPRDEGSGAGLDLSAEQIDEVVHQLNGIYRTSNLEFALSVGALILHHFYGGDTNAWRSRGPKPNSFRRLAEHPDLALSAGALYRCVAIFEMCDRLRAVSRWRCLGASHLRVVLGISMDKQEYLLNKANDERWSVQTLHTKAKAFREGRARGGRRAQSGLGKQLRTLDRCLQEWSDTLDSVHSNDLKELERSLPLLEKMKSSVEELAKAVEARRLRLDPPAQGRQSGRRKRDERTGQS